VFYVLGAVLGAYVSASVSGTLGQVKGVSVPASICGGFLLYIGARIGGGCTRYSKPQLEYKMCKLSPYFSGFTIQELYVLYLS